MLAPPRSLRDSVQSHPPANTVGAGPLIWDVVRGPILPPRGSKERDRILRLFDVHDFNSMWQGARKGLLDKLSSLPFEINGPRVKAQYYQDLLGYAHFGHGYKFMIRRVFRDYLTQSYGGIFEIAGPGDPDKPLLEAPTSLNHLDAGRCYVTGNPTYPLLYYSLWDGRLHKMHASRVYMMVDDPIADERYFGIGTSALERAISVAQREIRMNQYVDAKLDDKPQPGLLSLTGIGDPAWQMLVQKYMQDQQMDERPVFGRVLVLTSLDPNARVQAEFTAFSQVPELFDFTKYKDLDVNEFALAIGVDRQEMWELAGRSLGSGAQSETLAIKSRGKFYADAIDNLERFFNWCILPDDCEFRIKERDEQQDQMQAGIDHQYAQVADMLIKIGFDQAVVAKLLANKSETFKDAFTNDLGQVALPSGDIRTPAQVTQDAALDSNTPAPDQLIGAGQPAPAASSQTKAAAPCYVILSLANHPDLIAVQHQLKLTAPGIEWESPADFHVTLVHATAARTADLAGIKNVLPRSMNPFAFKAGPLGTFEAKDGRTPVFLAVQAPDTLKALQAGLHASFRSLGLTLSEYSAPDAWQPHITLGYAPSGAAIPTFGGSLDLTSDVAICSVPSDDGFEQIYVTKAFSATAADFRSRFANIVGRAASRSIRRSQAESFLLSLLLSSGRKAFADGLREGGIDEPLDDEETARVQAWVVDQIDYLDPLLAAAFAGDLSDAQVEARAQMWANKALGDMLAAGRLSADHNGLYEFYGSDGRVSCPTCSRLQGQVHRFKDWERKRLVPGLFTETFECGGWQCKHRLRKASGKARGNW